MCETKISKMKKVLSMTFLSIGLLYFNAPLRVNAVLRGTDPEVNEGPCQEFTPVTSPPLLKEFAAKPQVLVTTLASQSFFRTQAESFLGRPPSDQAEVDGLCPTILLTECFSTNFGYGQGVIAGPAVHTDKAGVYNFSTYVAKTNQVKLIPHVDTVVWIYKEHFISTRCVEGKMKDWKMSSLKPPSVEVMKAAVDFVRSIGFSPKLAWDMSGRSKCQIPSVSTLAIDALTAFDLFNNKSPLYDKPTLPITFGWKSYKNLATYYKSFIEPLTIPFEEERRLKCADLHHDDFGKSISSSSSSGYYADQDEDDEMPSSLGCKLFDEMY